MFAERVPINELTARTPAAQSLVEQVLNNQMVADEKFYLVILPDDDYPRLESFDTTASLVAAIHQLLGQDVAVFAFIGRHLPISKGPNRYLSTPFGVLPLFTLPNKEDMEFEEHGFIGKDQPTLAPPTASTEEAGETTAETPVQPTTEMPVLPD